MTQVNTDNQKTRLAHEHNWQLVDVDKGAMIYGGMAIGTSVYEYPIGKKPDVARYLCDCGMQKKVEVKL